MRSALSLLLVLAVTLTALVAVDFSTLPAGSGSPSASGSPAAFRALVSESARAERVIAAVELTRPSGATFLHLRSRGRWRSREAFGAGVDEAQLSALVDQVLQAHGTLRTREPGAGRAFGFASPRAVRIALCGRKVLDAEDGDRWFQADFAPGPTPGTGFARLAGEQAIYELDRDPASFVSNASSGVDSALPPLIETRLFDAPWLESTGGFASLRIERAGKEPFELAEQPAPPQEPGGVPTGLTWRDDAGGEVLPFRLAGYLSFLSAVRLDAVFDPRSAESTAFQGRIRLRPHRGPERVLELLPVEGGVLVWDAGRLVLARFGPPSPELFLPQRRDFGAERQGNPWEAYLVPTGPTGPPRGR